ncbi:MAG: hypothetical protein IJ215_03130 [Clostridia bacterium]|nr:hypothetical protein [Clostridia bacterium]
MARKTFRITENGIIMRLDDGITNVFPLCVISSELLGKIRRLYCQHKLKHTYAFVKCNGAIKAAKIPKLADLSGINGMTHICGTCSCGCVECPKVFDRFAESADKDEYGNVFFQDIKRIEKYPFIQKGIEVFNAHTGNQYLLVEECSKYQHMVPRGPEKPGAFQEKNKKLEALYQFFVTDKNTVTSAEYAGTKLAYKV